jgi:hypothetical protein
MVATGVPSKHKDIETFSKHLEHEDSPAASITIEKETILSSQ